MIEEFAEYLKEDMFVYYTSEIDSDAPYVVAWLDNYSPEALPMLNKTDAYAKFYKMSDFTPHAIYDVSGTRLK
jgi:hypothetical protein